MFDFRAHSCHSTLSGNARFRLQTPANAPEGQKQVPANEHMKKRSLTPLVAFAFPLIMTLFPLYLAAQAEDAESEDAQAEDANDASGNVNRPMVFQAADLFTSGPLGLGKPSLRAIIGAIENFRIALGGPNNLNNPGPLPGGRREINWDGGGVDVTTPPVTPFNVFLDSRGSQFTTPGTGLSQAPRSGGPQDGLRGLFDNPTYANIFVPFSQRRLFTPVGSNITNVRFFIPGTGGIEPAVVTGFGAVFSDVDQPDGIGGTRSERNRGASTLIEYFDVDGNVIFSSFVPASPGDATFSFFGIVFEKPVIARVRIRTGNSAPGPNENNRRDIVMMDDFFYGEPQPLSDGTQEKATEETPAAAAQAARGAAPASEALTVNNGRVSGTAAPRAVVTVTADAPPAGQKFAGWTGDIQILGNPSAATTTAIVPSTQVTITATYVDDSSAGP
jgi:hypothetical protein